MLVLDKKIASTSNPYDDALKCFKEKSGFDFLELVDSEEKRKELYEKGKSVETDVSENIQAIYNHTIDKHYK